MADRKWRNITEAEAEAAGVHDGDDDAQGLPGHFEEVVIDDKGLKLFQAAGNGRASELHKLLKQGVSAVDACDCDGSTALMAASGEGHAACVKLLVAFGANVDQRDEGGGGALHHACYRGQSECVELLLASGGDLNGTDKMGLTPTLAASISGSVECLAQLLELGADVTPKLQGRDALQWASERGHAKCAARLRAHLPHADAARTLVRRRVRLQGLKGRPELNGRCGLATRLDAERGRIGVVLEGGEGGGGEGSEGIMVKAENLTLAEAAEAPAGADAERST